MPAQLIFDEEAAINGNIYKFDQRMNTQMNKFIGESGAPILVTYFPQDEESTTVDRGLRDIEQLFGKKSPLRYYQVINVPLYDFGPANAENTDEQQIEDINVNGECIMLPCTISPKPMDFFIINHLKMKAIFEVTSVQYDTMKVEGFYRLTYRLHSTSQETIDNMKKQVTEKYHTDLNAIGTNKNPIIREKDYVKMRQIEQMVAKMISSYRALFYNSRHNCFLYHDQDLGMDIFDMCGNEFMAKHSIMNNPNSADVIMLHDKLEDRQLSLYYNNSIYSWLEIGAPARLLRKFFYLLGSSNGYLYSSFYMWNDEVLIIQPIGTYQAGINAQKYSFFDDTQFNALMDKSTEPSSEYEKLIWKYIHNGTGLTIDDVSLYMADTLISSIRHKDIFFYIPICIYIIRKILRMN